VSLELAGLPHFRRIMN